MDCRVAGLACGVVIEQAQLIKISADTRTKSYDASTIKIMFEGLLSYVVSVSTTLASEAPRHDKRS